MAAVFNAEAIARAIPAAPNPDHDSHQLAEIQAEEGRLRVLDRRPLQPTQHYRGEGPDWSFRSTLIMTNAATRETTEASCHAAA